MIALKRAFWCLALALVLPVHAFAQNAPGDDGPLRYQYMVDFWRTSPPGAAPGADPSEAAPGRIFPTKILLDRKTIPRAEAALFERKARLIVDALLAQPSFRDVRGTSLQPQIKIGQTRFGKLWATISIFTIAIDLANPATTKTDGRYFTPGQQAELRVKVNSELPWIHEIPRSRGTYNGNMIGEAKGEPFPYVATNGRSPFVTKCCTYKKEQYEDWNDAFYDASLPGTRVQYVAAKAFFGTYHRGLWDGTHPPTSKVGRMIAALLMVDWPGLVRRMEVLG